MTYIPVFPPDYPFNQTDLENIYNELDRQAIDQGDNLKNINDSIDKTNNVIQQNSLVYFDTEHDNDKTAHQAMTKYKAFIDNIIASNYMIISHELVCSPRPPSIQTNNDWVFSCYYMSKI